MGANANRAHAASPSAKFLSSRRGAALGLAVSGEAPTAHFAAPRVARRCASQGAAAVLAAPAARRPCSRRALRAAAMGLRAGATATSAEDGPPGWRRVVFLTACTMALCNIDRVLLSVAGLPMAAEFAFNSPTMGVLQSSYLWGYGLGQLPSGLLSDRFGGPRVLLGGLALWSLATLALPLARSSAAPLAVLTLTRVLFGFGSAVALPAVSATVSRLVPESRRASNLAVIYAAFNMGSLAGMGSTPPLIAAAGWPACFVLYGMLGLVWTVVATAALPGYVRAGKDAPGTAATCAPAISGGSFALRRGGAAQLTALVWVHSVIGWGFFVMLSWIPTYLVQSLEFTDLRMVGVVSALPWLVCAVVGMLAGALADWLGTAQGWDAFRVRSAMNRVATLGPAASLLLLPFATGPITAVLCLCAASASLRMDASLLLASRR